MYKSKYNHTTIVVFHTLNIVTLPIAMFVSVLGWSVHYLHVKGIEKNQFLALLLRKTKIKPINLELANHVCDSDPQNDFDGLIDKVTDCFAEKGILAEFSRYFINVFNPERKLRTLIHTMVSNECYDAGLIRTWIESEHPECEILWLWYPPIFGRELAKPANCRTVSLCPITIVLVAKLFVKMLSILQRLFLKMINTICIRSFPKKITDTSEPRLETFDPQTVRVLYFPHDGVWFGRLFKKDYYYSSQVTSPFHPTKILHVNYGESSEKGIHKRDGYTFVRIDAGSNIQRLGYKLKTLPSWRFVWRSWRNVVTAAILTSFYSSFRGYIDWLSQFPQVNTAIVGYDILMPLDITMALEASKIRSVGAQERMSQTWCNGVSINLDTYFCASDMVAENLANAQHHDINFILPVGMQRTDWLYEAKEPNLTIKGNAGRKPKKCIIALNYHSVPDYEENRTQPVINWRANRLFFEDMIKLAKEIDNIHIIIRGKDDVWCNLPYFSDVVDAIENTPNINVNRDYDRQKVSYELCANTDLVIAKHTSLGDECLAVGIPVLFHEYTHNCQEGQTKVFAYPGLENIVRDYLTLKRRTQELLSMSHEDYMKKYGEALRKIYGDYNDGHVCERIRAELEKIHSSSRS